MVRDLVREAGNPNGDGPPRMESGPLVETTDPGYLAASDW